MQGFIVEEEVGIPHDTGNIDASLRAYTH